MNSNDKNKQRDDEHLISSYTRTQAIEDGVLVDVTEMACEAGFRYPVALTAAAYAKYVEVPQNVTGQDLEGRLWDILWMLSCRIRRIRSAGFIDRRIPFHLHVRNSDSHPPKLVRLFSQRGPGDDHEPVITVMLPGED